MVKYIQGDVVGVYNNSGTKLVTFKYDAFGRCTVSGDTNLAQWCRIRYRGYYFDTETGFYWVQTRYYNPEWCRWISPDSIGYLDPETVHGLNLYTYCGNDPLNFIDPTGHIAVAILYALFVMGVTVIGGGIDGGMSAEIVGQDFWKGFGAGAIGGLASGFVLLINPQAVKTARFLGSLTYNMLNEVFQTGELRVENIGMHVDDAFVDATLTGLYSQGLSFMFGNYYGSSMSVGLDGAIDLFQTWILNKLNPTSKREYLSDEIKQAVREVEIDVFGCRGAGLVRF